MTLNPEQLRWYGPRMSKAQCATARASDAIWQEGRWHNFTPNEIACRGTGLLFVNPDALDKLQVFRTLLGLAFSPNSAFRTEEHNAAIGGGDFSMHKLGIAFDVPMVAPVNTLVQLAEQVGFQGIGVYSWGIHMDDRPWVARW